MTVCVAAIIFFICPCTYPADTQKPAEPILIRVAVVKDVNFVKIFIPGRYRIINLITKEPIFEEEYLPRAKLISTDKGFRLNGVTIDVIAIGIEPVAGTRVYINDRIFRGQLKVLKGQSGLIVVNTVELEEYLYGVLRNEISTWWPMEALKAQAIAARTYAIYQTIEARGKEYDVTADVSSQVYGGIFSEKWRTNRAIDLTKGEVLAYEGKIFPAYFHATCGGGTLDASYLWKIDLPPLKGVKCDWCKKSPHYSWERWVTLKEAQSKLEKAGYMVGQILGIETVEKDPSGRILKMRIKGSYSTADILAKDFRRIIGTDIIRSTNFKITIISDYLAFDGLGWGHGVGLCQWGAYYMSRAGKKADEILAFYYPGSAIVAYESIR